MFIFLHFAVQLCIQKRAKSMRIRSRIRIRNTALRDICSRLIDSLRAAYTDGINCPWDIPDQWEYEYQREWFVDPTLKVLRVKPMG
jgi:hypothetical protein